jgi:NADH:ubiquinone oxidoreductase subunit
MERGEYWGSIYQSPVDDAEAALADRHRRAGNGEDVPFLNYFDTPKITQDNMDEFDQAGLLIVLPGRGRVREPPQNARNNEERTGGAPWDSGVEGRVCIVTGAARASAVPLAKRCWTKVPRSVLPTSMARWQRRWPRPRARAGRMTRSLQRASTCTDRSQVRE